jgi:hypothetical protein
MWCIRVNARPFKWIESGYPLGRGWIKIYKVEVVAVAEALQTAQEKASIGDETWRSIHVALGARPRSSTMKRVS